MERLLRNPVRLWAVLVLLLALGAWLRLQYIQTVSLHVDEFTTMWAATLVQKQGIPRTPAGVLYTRGLLNTYVEAGFFALFGATYAVARSVSLLFGLGSIVVVFWIGRRGWNARVGLLAAAGLTLLPEAIIWSGRARFYSQLQFFALLATWAAFVVITDTTADRPTQRRGLWAFALFFLLALFSQEETLLLYPSILLTMFIWRGWRWMLQPQVLAIHATLFAGMTGRYLMEIMGQPGYFETIQSARPYVGLVFDVVGAWRTYAPLLIAPVRLPWTILGLIALVVALVMLLTRARHVTRLSRFHQATLFFGLQLLSVLVMIFVLVGTSWREARYLYFVQPFWLLLGAAGALWVLERLLSRTRDRRLATGALILAVLVSMWPGAQQVLAQQVEGYDRVLEYVAAQRDSQDKVLSPQPPACALLLGPCDGYAIQRGFEEFVVPKDGVLVDRWSGAPLINTTAQLHALIAEGTPVWLVTDSFRLATRYDADYLRTVIEQFDVAHAEQGVLALKADGLRTITPPVERVAFDPPRPFGPLLLTGYERSEAATGDATTGNATAGDTLAVTLLWTSAAAVPTQYNTSLRLVDANGVTVAQQDGPPARAIVPTTLIFDQPVPDVKQLSWPAALPIGEYQLVLVVYDVATVTPVTEPQVIGQIVLRE